MHRLTRDKQRADIQPVPPAQLMRFLFRWHQLACDTSDERREGEAGLADVLRQLEGHAAPASAWEDELLCARVSDYEPAMLDKLCAVGRVVWWRPSDSSEAQRSGPIRGTPIVLAERDTLPHWQQAAGATAPDDPPLSSKARAVLAALRTHGASFFSDLQRDAGSGIDDVDAAGTAQRIQPPVDGAKINAQNSFTTLQAVDAIAIGNRAQTHAAEAYQAVGRVHTVKHTAEHGGLQDHILIACRAHQPQRSRS
jgi:hypothetical protein